MVLKYLKIMENKYIQTLMLLLRESLYKATGRKVKSIKIEFESPLSITSQQTLTPILESCGQPLINS